MAELRIGTSGWQYGHWRGRFYPEKLPVARWFEHYARHFDSVELNSPFYRLPPRGTFVHWRKQAPRGFAYAVKINRYLTHIKRLNASDESVARFYEALGGLGPLAAAVLVQLPPKMKYDAARAERFFRQIARRRRRHALEPRDGSWLTDEALAHLRRKRIALCIATGLEYPTREATTADFTYLRFHGTAGRYTGDYRDAELREWADRIREWRRQGIDVYAYFNNDQHAYAIKNALRLRELAE